MKPSLCHHFLRKEVSYGHTSGLSRANGRLRFLCESPFLKIENKATTAPKLLSKILIEVSKYSVAFAPFMYLKRVALTSAIMILLYLSVTATAASAKVAIKTEITPEMFEMGCAFLVEGVIEKGDAKEVARAIEDFQIGLTFEFTTEAEFPLLDRMCFNSVGGSLLEGLEIAKVLQDLGMGSAVARSHRCESACALAFLGGSSLYYIQFLPTSAGSNRLLHPKGLLGFHAPGIGLAVDDARRYSAVEAESLFNLGLEAVFEIVSMASTGNLITPSLLLTILSTSQKEMRYVETVGDALRWEIEVGPVGFPDQDPLLGLVYGCMHASKPGAYVEKNRLFRRGEQSGLIEGDVFENGGDDEFLKERGWKSFLDGFELSELSSGGERGFGGGRIKGRFWLQFLTSSRMNNVLGITSCDFSLGSLYLEHPKNMSFINPRLRERDLEPSQSISAVFDGANISPFAMYWIDKPIADLTHASPYSFNDYFLSLQNIFYGTSGSQHEESGFAKPDWCSRAKTNLEKKICSSRDLSDLDVRLNQIYAVKKEIAGVQKIVVERMRQRLDCELDEACIRLVYLEALRMLEGF